MFKQVLTYIFFCRVPRDINPDASVQDVQMGGESPKANKPPTSGIEKTTPEYSKLPCPSGAQSSPDAGGALPPPPKAASSQKSASPKQTETRKTVPSSPWTFGLGTIGGPSLAGESSVPQAGKSLWWYAQVEESLTKDPEFIKAGFNIGRFVTTAVDTKKDRTNMDTL
jgi:hypothetical protein